MVVGAVPPALGEPKGFAERAIVADAIFAIQEGTGTRVLVTNDAKLYAAMARRMYPDLKPTHLGYTDLVLSKYPNGFDFKLNGQTFRVFPVPPT